MRARVVLAALAVVTIGLIILAAVGAITIPNLNNVIEDAPEELGRWTYAFGAGMSFLEFSSIVGVPIAFEIGVLFSGVVAGQGEIHLIPLILLVWIFGTLGEQINFLSGRHYGRPFLERHGPRFRVSEEKLRQLEAWFDRRGIVAVLVGRFIPLVRSAMPFVAGTSTMTFRTYGLTSTVGNVGWSAAICGIGYGFSSSADKVADNLAAYGQVVLGAALLLTMIWLLIRRRRRRQRPAS